MAHLQHPLLLFNSRNFFKSRIHFRNSFPRCGYGIVEFALFRSHDFPRNEVTLDRTGPG